MEINKINKTVLKFCVQYLGSSFSVKYVEKTNLVICVVDLNPFRDLNNCVNVMKSDYNEMVMQYDDHLKDTKFTFYPTTKVIECLYYFK